MGTNFIDFFKDVKWSYKQALLQTHKSNDAAFYARVGVAQQALQAKPHLAPKIFATEIAYAGPLTGTPEILASRTYCEITPAPVVACKDFLETYRKLYTMPTLSPVMDAVAMALLPNNYYNNNIVISHTHEMEFFGSPGASAHATAYGDIVFSLPSYFSNSYQESKGGAVLMHEITHVAMRKVFNNSFLPYAKSDSQALKAYEQALKETIARANHTYLPHAEKLVADPHENFCNQDPVGNTQAERYMVGRIQYSLCDDPSTTIQHMELIAIAMQTVAYLHFEGLAAPHWIEPLLAFKDHYINSELQAYLAVKPIAEALMYEATH
jgi:hypothetical protein